MENKFKITEDLYTSKGNRLANFIIDRIVFYGLFYGISICLGIILVLFGVDVESITYKLETINPVLDYLITGFVFTIFYFLAELLLKGRTVGKYITKTVVVDIDGNTPKAAAVLYRSLSRLIPFEAFTFLAQERGLHDKLSKTYVVDVHEFKRKQRLFGELNQIGEREE